MLCYENTINVVYKARNVSVFLGFKYDYFFGVIFLPPASETQM